VWAHEEILSSDELKDETKRPFRVLSLDGGGSKGVYTLGVLREVEAMAGAPLHEVFNLIFGTSTGSIITALLGLGYSVDQIDALYIKLIPKIMTKRTSWTRTRALRVEATKIFGEKDFSAFKIPVGIVCANYERERPMIFKNTPEQAHLQADTFVPGFGCSIADAIVASSSAYPFFDKVTVKTKNQGKCVLMDGGYVANNPTLFALADACQSFQKKRTEVAVLSVGVGIYNEPQKSLFHQLIFRQWEYKLIAKMFNTSSKTVEQLREILFSDVVCIRINESYADNQYSTDLLESDPDKLDKLKALGRESFRKFQAEIKTKLKF
jgi:predicted patatin/cPLA2 family phospholipase